MEKFRLALNGVLSRVTKHSWTRHRAQKYSCSSERASQVIQLQVAQFEFSDRPAHSGVCLGDKHLELLDYGG
jgi:hypothetical protein